MEGGMAGGIGSREGRAPDVASKRLRCRWRDDRNAPKSVNEAGFAISPKRTYSATGSRSRLRQKPTSAACPQADVGHRAHVTRAQILSRRLKPDHSRSGGPGATTSIREPNAGFSPAVGDMRAVLCAGGATKVVRRTDGNGFANADTPKPDARGGRGADIRRLDRCTEPSNGSGCGENNDDAIRT